eukprot:SAG11_NODE_39401_length_233_cov_3.731343_1_plen_28_part_10
MSGHAAAVAAAGPAAGGGLALAQPAELA